MNLLKFHQAEQYRSEPIPYDLYDLDGNYLGTMSDLERYKRCQVKIVELDEIDGQYQHHIKLNLTQEAHYENSEH